MATLTITRGTTLPDSSGKADFHALIDNATATLTNVVNADIDAAAAIADSKLAQITTASKVNVSAITGTLGTANGGTGATAAANAASGVVVLDSSSKLPAVDGSQLTNLPSKASYDSGWFAIANGGTYTKTHNLGTTNFLVLYDVSQNSNGQYSSVGVIAYYDHQYDAAHDKGMMIYGRTTTEIKLNSPDCNCCDGVNAAGTSFERHTSGYARIRLYAL